jgi:hypothetical protein
MQRRQCVRAGWRNSRQDSRAGAAWSQCLDEPLKNRLSVERSKERMEPHG